MTDEQMKQLQALYPWATAEQLESARAFVEQLAEALTPVWESVKALVTAWLPAAKVSVQYYIEQAELEKCPNRRVAYLAKHARKARVRKKNLHRAARINKKEGTA